jgi:hypothetical protein
LGLVEEEREVPGLGPKVGEAQKRGEREGTRPRSQTEKRRGMREKKERGMIPLLGFPLGEKREKRAGSKCWREGPCKGEHATKIWREEA